MPRISQLPSLTTADNSDEIAIVDVSASVTKKITRGDLLKAPLPNNAVTTASITNGAVTASKIDFATLNTKTLLTPASGFVNASVSKSQSYFIKRGNQVEVYIAVEKSSGNVAGGNVVCVMPAAVRPASNSEYLDGNGGGGLSALVAVRANGNVEVTGVTGASNLLIARGTYYL